MLLIFFLILLIIALVLFATGLGELIILKRDTKNLERRFTKRIMLFYRMFIIILAFNEMLIPFIIIVLSQKEYYELAFDTVIYLVIFISISAFIYHFPPFKRDYIGFLKEISIIIVLLIIAFMFKSRDKIILGKWI